MKRLLIVLSLCLVAVPALAGVGIHVNYDFSVIEEDVRQFTFEGDPAGYSTTTLARDKSVNPIGAGIDLSVGILPIIDIMMSIEGSFASYTASFIPPPQANQDPIEEDLAYLRVGVDLTGFFNVVSFPPLASVVDVMVGIGPSVLMQSPIFTEELVKEKINSADEEFDILNLVETPELLFGGHAALQLKIHPPKLPMGIRLMGKYYIVPDALEPAPGNWFTVSGGIYIFG